MRCAVGSPSVCRPGPQTPRLHWQPKRLIGLDVGGSGRRFRCTRSRWGNHAHCTAKPCHPAGLGCHCRLWPRAHGRRHRHRQRSGCQGDAECGKADDGNLCNGVWFCNKAVGACQFNPHNVIKCPTVDDTACSKTQCNPKIGTCEAVFSSDGLSCDDANPCTADDCDPVAGCSHKLLADGAPCSDAGETCQKGQCLSIGQEASPSCF